MGSRGTAEVRPTRDDTLRFAASATSARLSKFEPCLPDALLNSPQAEALLTRARLSPVQNEGTQASALTGMEHTGFVRALRRLILAPAATGELLN